MTMPATTPPEKTVLKLVLYDMPLQSKRMLRHTIATQHVLTLPQSCEKVPLPVDYALNVATAPASALTVMSDAQELPAIT
jgi:hypothetical protein